MVTLSSGTIRSVLHQATAYDTERHRRLMQRTTVGNPNILDSAAYKAISTQMTSDKQYASAHEALDGVKDGAVVMISGFGGAGFPNVLIRALVERETRDLTLVVNSTTHRMSLTHELIAARQVRRVICSAARGHAPGLSVLKNNTVMVTLNWSAYRKGR